MFQSLVGRLKTEDATPGMVVILPFQSLVGRLKTYAADLAAWLKGGFNPS